MKCGVDYGFSGIPQFGEFTYLNESAALESENMNPSGGISCSFEDFHIFKSFLLKFMPVVREFYLPPEKLRFGLVSERSLLSSLAVRDSGSWLMMLYFAGCPNCSMILREEDDLKTVLQKQALLVTELECNEQKLVPALPANEPSILLFIDRSSDSLTERRQSKEALDTFRELANNVKSEKPSVRAYKSLRSTTHHPGLELIPLSQKLYIKDKISVMIMKEGKPVTLDKVASDLPGNSLHDILVKLLEHKKEIKLSSLAKDVGFQLLSDDFDVKLVEALPAQKNVHSNQVSKELHMEEFIKSNIDVDRDQIPHSDGPSEGEHDEHPQCDVKKTFVKTMIESFIEPDRCYTDKAATDGKVEGKNLSLVENIIPSNIFRGSFFFSDGHSWLLKALTGGYKIPSVVIINPNAQRHYVFSEEAVCNYTVLCDFLDRFLNGSLLPYQRSESIVLSPRESPRPPFVNLDCHEADAIPRVSVDAFSELVIGNQSDSSNASNAWKKDVLVLFSNSWCGFCQRMELVVREVYRAFKGYINMLKNESRNNKSSLSSGDMKEAMSEIPLIYLMDCTLNDCSLIIKSLAEREFYPSLLLFPAERKNVVPYGGDMAVSDIIKFIADRGSNSHRLFKEKGILWMEADQGGGYLNSFEDASQTLKQEKYRPAKDKYYEVLLKERTPRVYNQFRPHMLNGSQDTAVNVVAGSILSATDLLLNSHPFDKSKILIVKVNQSTGFQGLIINKHITWDSFNQLEEGLELLKEAPLSFGGPVILHGMPLVALTRKFINDQYHPEVLPNIYFIDQRATFYVLEGLKLGKQSVADYWFFLGYSSWGWDQLFDEIVEGAWNISNGNVEQLDWPWR